MSKTVHFILVASCQAEGSKCINSLHLRLSPLSRLSLSSHTCTRRWSGHCGSTKTDDSVLNRPHKRLNLGVISQHQMFSRSYESALMLFSCSRSISLLSSAVFISQGFVLSLSVHLLFFSFFFFKL